MPFLLPNVPRREFLAVLHWLIDNPDSTQIQIRKGMEAAGISPGWKIIKEACKAFSHRGWIVGTRRPDQTVPYRATVTHHELDAYLLESAADDLFGGDLERLAAALKRIGKKSSRK